MADKAKFTVNGPEDPQNRRNDIMIRRQLRISDIVYILRKNIVLIAVCAAIGMVLGIILSVVSYMRGEMSKQYAIKTSIAVTSQTPDGMFTTNKTDSPTSTDIHLAEDMVAAILYVMKSDKMLEEVIEQQELTGISVSDISRNLELKQYAETQIIEITLYWRSAEEGVLILEGLNKVAPDVLIETLKIGNLTVINHPKARYLIGGNLNAALWGYMMVFGGMMGVGFVMLNLLIRPKLLHSSDVESNFHMEILGEIPDKKDFFKKKRNLLVGADDDELYMDVLDNYMSVSQIIRNRIQNLEHTCIYVTSAEKDEGKTTVTAYLAYYLAELGLKVLLIDFDTRNPRLGSMFLNKVDYNHSINALYRGESTRAETISTLTENLDILPAVLEHRSLPLDDALQEMVRELRVDYDVVLMDTSPVGQVADTMRLNELADLALFVIRIDSAGLDVIRDAIGRMDKSGIRIMGCVVNGVKSVRSEHSYYGSRKRTSFLPAGKSGKSMQQKEWKVWENEQDGGSGK